MVSGLAPHIATCPDKGFKIGNEGSKVVFIQDLKGLEVVIKSDLKDILPIIQ